MLPNSRSLEDKYSKIHEPSGSCTTLADSAVATEGLARNSDREGTGTRARRSDRQGSSSPPRTAPSASLC